MITGDRLVLDPKPASEVLYPRGSIVVCYHCAKPLYRLQASIYVGEPMARTAWKYAPIEVADIIGLMDRRDLEPGQRAAITDVPLADWQRHCEQIPSLRAGAYADCPACRASFVYAQTRAKDDGAPSFADKGYLIELAVIPPMGQARRKVH